MFNIYEFDKRRTSQEHEDAIQKTTKEWKAKAKVNNVKMASKYRERVGNFIKTMVVDNNK